MLESFGSPTDRSLNGPLMRRGRMIGLSASSLLLAACFGRPLRELLHLSLSDELYSHMVLLPFICGYLVWLKRGEFSDNFQSGGRTACVFLAGGLAALIFPLLLNHSGHPLAREDSLAFTISSFLLLFGGICSWYLGRRAMIAAAFPYGLLFLLIPFPSYVLQCLQSFLQNQSANVAFVLFKLAGTPVYFYGLTFQLPGISIEVAPQCSGIHSSLALFVTALLAGYFFLRSQAKRFLLVAAVVPLAIARNGFRVFSIGELCVHVSPDMIDSEIHHHGGPVFFALSLIPFFLLLFFLAKSERVAKPALDSAS